MPERFFAPCPRGLEASLATELGAIGASDIAAADGGVGFAGDLSVSCRANLESRLASRILWRVGGGAYRDDRDLYALVHALEWHRLFKAERTLRVDVTATRAPLKSLEFATLRIKDAVCDRFRAEQGSRPSVDKRAPDVRVTAYLTERDATIYVDTSGDPLFKRGYRRAADEAPLRENLAAGLLALTGWTPEQPLLDPMCGSGTIAVEAALIAANRAPGLARSFGFQKLAWYDGPAWQRMKQAARDRVRSAPATPSIFASDVAQAAVANCAANLATAGVRDFVIVDRIDVLDREPPAPAGLLLANPPYGERLDDAAALAVLYPKLGDVLKRRFAGWTACFLTADLRLAKLIGLKAARRTPLYNGPLECRLFAFPLVAGSMR
ncbi:MAG TPA: THUMP domain-containing protein [Casimicrobiaceae bacterium]|nr:THUMP domain-containing protein [Casimicrobiaceae bacterium]